jgi:hypothetical protein
MRIILFVLLTLMMTVPVYANESRITLNCKADTGEPTVDLTLNLDAKEMKWGTASTYLINNISDEYITASLVVPEGHVGGEIWVMSRSSGKYWRANVGMSCKTSKCTSEFMNIAGYQGTCLKKVF